MFFHKYIGGIKHALLNIGLIMYRINEAAFTLVELLVAVTLIGILAALAIPQFNNYKAGGFDARAQMSLRHVAVAEEAYFVDHSTYKNCNQSTCAAILPGLGVISPGVLLQITSTATGFSGTATHPQGSGKIFDWVN